MNIDPESAKEITCKNVTIYGFCKYEKKGCVFSHDNASLASANTLTPKASSSKLNSAESQGMSRSNGAGGEQTSKKKFNASTPSFQPSVLSITNKFSSLSPKLKDLPLFVPASLEKDDGASTPTQTKKFNASTPSFTPSYEGSNHFGGSALGAETQQLVFSPLIHLSLSNFGGSGISGQQQLQTQQNPYLAGPAPSPLGGMGNMGSSQASDFMFAGGLSASSYALNHHLYAPAPPPRLAMSLSDHQTNVNDMFIPNNLREELMKKNEATLQTLPQLTLPDQVGDYHSLVPMDSTFTQPSKVYDMPSYVYKATSNVNGVTYALRRLDFNNQAQYSQNINLRPLMQWKKIRNPNVVKVHDAFTTVAFGTYEPVLSIVYDYYPLANTLQEQHITRKLGGKLEPITEDLLWSYFIQISNALIEIHSHRLIAGSSLMLSKILVTNKGRVRLGAVGVDDVLEPRDKRDLEEAQLKDYDLFKQTMFDLVKTTVPQIARQGSYDTVISKLSQASTPYSEEFIEALDAFSNLKDISLEDFFSEYLALRSLKVLSGFEDQADHMESQLTSEIENGRLFRLMAKLDLLVNLSEKDKADNGSFYVIKLFQQFVFNSYDECGKPVVDLSRILYNLNKLDAGVDEKILLISAEEDSCIIVSYKEVKNIIELTFRGVFR